MEDQTSLFRRARLCRVVLQALFLGLGAVLALMVISAMLEPAYTGAWLARFFGYPAHPISGMAGAGIVIVTAAILAAWLAALGTLACLFDAAGWTVQDPQAPARAAARATFWVSVALGLSIVGQVPLSLLATLGAEPGSRMIAIGISPAHAVGLIATVVVAFLAVVLRMMADLWEDQREIV